MNQNPQKPGDRAMMSFLGIVAWIIGIAAIGCAVWLMVLYFT